MVRLSDRAFMFHMSFLWKDLSIGIKVKVICQGEGQISRSHFLKKKKRKKKSN